MKKENEKHIGFCIKTLSNMLTRKIEYMAAKEGDDAVAMMHGWFLGYLYEHMDENIYHKNLEDEFKLSKPAVTAIVKALENNGCIRRESVDFDARLKKVVILDKGIEIHKKSLGNVKYVDKIMEEGISREELETFFRVSEKIKENLTKIS